MSLTPFVPPSGTVTFLFTDIEGSTVLWEQQPDAMRAALARHDALLRQAIAAENGFVFQTVGDAFCAAFATAPEALAASLAAQRALLSEPSDLSTPLRVRMGLHTGTAEVRDGDYFGQPLNRVSRLMTAGHGGQILMSVACQELTRDTLPAAVTLRDLGPHRLKDLSRPEQVFQVLHPDLPADFPPLKSLNNPGLPNNLPQQMTSFIGRKADIAAIKALLEKSRLLTLTGAGGAGKTRLSLQAAADLLDGSADGVWLAELAPLTDPDLVPQAVAEVLGVREEPGRPIAKTLADALKSKRLLLVLDNCEHVLNACAFLVSDLLRVCPNVSILATSREALGVAGEQTYRVPSLSLPDPKQTYSAEALGQYEAVRLFIDRACLSQSSFAVTNQNAPAVAQICARLDGIPLAIELASARIKALTAEQISTRLDDRFRLLTGGSRTALPRQQTLKAAIDWSFELLTGSEKTLLCRLSVFSGGWTLEAAEAVCADPRVDVMADSRIEQGDTLDLLTSLVDKSLVVYEEDAEGYGRYHLLETVRQYGRDRLGESGEETAVHQWHQSYFLMWAEQAEALLNSPEQVVWMKRLELEYGNMRTALDWSLEEENGTEASLRLSIALGTFWLLRGDLSAGRQWLNRALNRDAQERDQPTEAAKSQQRTLWRCQALSGAANLDWCMGKADAAQILFEQALIQAREAGEPIAIAYALRGLGMCKMSHETVQDDTAVQALFEESLELFRQAKHPVGITYALRNLGDLAEFQDDYTTAQALYSESLSLSRQLENKHGIAGSLVSLGRVAFAQGELNLAQTLHEEALSLSQQMGDQGAIVHSLGLLGQVAFAQGKLNLAQSLHTEALPIAQLLGHPGSIAFTLAWLGRVAVRQGDRAAAWALHTESLRLRQKEGHLPAIASGLVAFAEMAQSRNQSRRAARLLGASHTLRQASGAHLIPVEREEHSKQLASVREVLGEEGFAAAFAEGQAMTLDAAMEYALAGADESSVGYTLGNSMGAKI